MAQLPKGGLVRAYDKPIHGSCAIYFPGGIKGGIGSIFDPPEGKDYKWYISGIFPANWGIICYRSHLLQEPETTIDPSACIFSGCQKKTNTHLLCRDTTPISLGVSCYKSPRLTWELLISRIYFHYGCRC